MFKWMSGTCVVHSGPKMKPTSVYCYDVDSSKCARENSGSLIDPWTKLCNQIVCTVKVSNISWCSSNNRDVHDCILRESLSSARYRV